MHYIFNIGEILIKEINILRFGHVLFLSTLFLTVIVSGCNLPNNLILPGETDNDPENHLYKQTGTANITVTWPDAVTITRATLSINGIDVRDNVVVSDTSLQYTQELEEGEYTFSVDLTPEEGNARKVTEPLKIQAQNTTEKTIQLTEYDFSLKPDTEPPNPGGGGSINSSNVTSTSITIEWISGTDNTCPVNDLEYKIVRSRNNNIGSPEDAEANGTTVMDWSVATTDATSFGLSPDTQYWFNVFLKDKADLISSYNSVTETTLPPSASSRFADHTVVEKLWTGQIPESAIQHAKDTLHIGYGHTSHGSQLSSGMTGLVSFANDGHLGTAYTHNLFERSQDGSGNTLHIFEGTGGWLSDDAGYYPQWVNETREFLDDPSHSEYNVIIWSWCGQVSSITEQNLIDEYLNPMTLLEADYPGVTFVYMTGHLNGTGEDGNLHLRNEQIRQFCIENDKWLYDFADIESYDPDGNYYLDRGGDDGCDYDGGNWASEWQDSHPEGEEWYDCYSAHSEPLNANMKAYAAWWLWTRLAGWDGN